MTLRIVFMGSPVFVIPVLETLHASPHELVGVYCRAPDTAGRGMKLRKVPVHEFADAHAIPVFTPKSLRKAAAQEELAALKPDIAVVAGYGMILPQAVLDIPRYGCLNIHPSLLPRWRGATPVQRTIEAGDAETAVCVMQLEAGMDTGPLWHVSPRMKVPADATSDTLYDTLFRQGADALLSVIDRVIAGEKPTPQATDGVTHAAMVTKAEAELDFNKPADVLERQVRAFTPWPGTWFISHGTRIKVHAAAVGPASTAPAGTLLDIDGIIACGNGTSLHLTSVQREGKPKMDAPSFFRGFGIKAGDSL